MTNENRELETNSFYGSARRNGSNYMTPLERKALREKLLQHEQNKKSASDAVDNKSLLLGKTALPATNAQRPKGKRPLKRKSLSQSKQNLHTGFSGAFILHTAVTEKQSKVDLKPFGVKHPVITSTPSHKKTKISPSISWAPSSLGKKYIQCPKKYANLQLCKTPPARSGAFTFEKVRLSSAVESNNKENKVTVEDEISEPESSFNTSNELLQSSPTAKLAKRQTKQCVKELLIYSQESQHNKSSGDLDECENASKPISANHNANKVDVAKYYPIFSSKRISPVLTSNVRRKLLASSDQVSPKTKHISLPTTPKVQKYNSSSENSPASTQMVIDAGQKKFGATQCDVCGMVYTVNHPQDQQAHVVHHNKLLSCIKFSGWKKERVVSSFMDGRVLKILPSDAKYAIKKIEEIRSVIDSDLGFSYNAISKSSMPKVTFLYVSDDAQILGCLIAEPASRAYRLLPTCKERASLSCSLHAQEVTCGVSRIWTYAPFRRRGVASRLCDAMRRSFVLGAELELNQIAFSDPTPDGSRFAAKYCKTDEFLTYNFTH